MSVLTWRVLDKHSYLARHFRLTPETVAWTGDDIRLAGEREARWGGEAPQGSDSRKRRVVSVLAFKPRSLHTSLGWRFSVCDLGSSLVPGLLALSGLCSRPPLSIYAGKLPVGKRELSGLPWCWTSTLCISSKGSGQVPVLLAPPTGRGGRG